VPEPATTAVGNGHGADDSTPDPPGDRPDPTDAGASSPVAAAPTSPARGPVSGGSGDKLPIKMLNDRVLVRVDGGEGERTSSGGILIPATAQISKRLAWAEVVAIGPNVRAMQLGDHVLFNPEDRYEVEVRGADYIILRERDVHAVAATRLGEVSTGLYL
jgi:chaperonin GroES